MDLLKMLAAERKEVLKGIESGKKWADALLNAIQALGAAGQAAAKAYGKAISKPTAKRKLSAAGKARIAAAAKKRWAAFRAAKKKASQ